MFRLNVALTLKAQGHSRSALFKGLAVLLLMSLLVSMDGGYWQLSGSGTSKVRGPKQSWGTAKGRGHVVDAGRNHTRPKTVRSRYPLTRLKKSAQPQPIAAKVAKPPTPELKEPPKGSGFDPKTSTELPAVRGTHSRTFSNKDGTQSTEVSPRPINYRKADGSWAPIDARLVPVGDAAQPQGWRNAADSVDIRLAPRAGPGPVARLALDAGHEIAYALHGAAQVAGQAGEHEVRYPGVRPDTDLRVEPGPGAIKETIVLRSVDAPATYVFPLALKGLTARVVNGQVDFRDESGRVRATVPAGFMTDSAETPATSTKVSYAIVSAEGAPALQVSADPKWLRDPARRFPVQLDPTVEIAAAGTSISVGDGGSSNGAQELTIGARSAAYLAFPQIDERLRYHRIFGAFLWMVNYDSATCSSRPVSVHAATQAWQGQSGLTYPGPGVGPSLVKSSFNHGYIAFGATKSNCPTKPVTFNLGKGGRDLIQRWVNGTQPNYGLSVRDASTDGRGYKKFTGHDTANPPRLIVWHSAYNASYAIPNPVIDPPVTQAQSGKIKITVTNTGAETWTPSTYYLAYRVYDKKGKLLSQHRSANLAGNVARGGKAKLDAVIKPLAPGTYSLDFTMVHTGGPVFIEEQVPPIRLIVKIIDIPPVLQELYPPNGYQSQTLTPQLWATAVDLDAPPGSALQYKYEVCERTSTGGAIGCWDSGYLSTHAWTVPAGKLSWNKAYLWRVFVKDGTTGVPSPRVTLLTSVPQPELTSRLAGGSSGSGNRGFDPQIGNYTSTAVDAPVATVGPTLNVERTYNSLDPRRDSAFGAGWMTRYDMKLAQDQDGSGNVQVTYPDGQQVRYGKNPDGTFAPPPGRQATLTVDASSRWKLVDKAGGTFEFLNGRIVKIADSTGQAITLTYNPQDGRLSKAASPGGRSLTFAWSGSPARVASVSTDLIDGRTLTWTYTYTGDLLSKACAPGGRCTTYEYGSGSHYRGAVLDSRPESYYRLSEDEGPGAGSQIAINLGKDGGTYKNVTLGAPGAIAGTGDTAASFNGSSSQLALPPGTVKKSRDMAVEVWFKNLTTGSGGPLVGYQDKPLDGTPGLGVPALYVGLDGKLRGQFWSGGTISPITSAATVNNGTWHHAVLSATGSTQTLYLDGNLVGTLANQTPNPITLTHNQIGAAYATTPGSWTGWGTNSRRFYNGTIDEVAVYHHPLGPDSVKAHWTEGKRAADQVTKVTLPSGKVAAEIEYDTAWDRLSEYTDSNGGTWKIKTPTVYGGDEDLRRAVEIRDPAGRPQLYEYDALAGRLIRMGLPTGLTVRDEDRPGSPTPTPSPTPTFVCTSPDPGDPSFCTTLPPNPGDAPDFIGHSLDGMSIRTFEYDDRGFPAVITNENGSSVKLTHDARGNVTARTTCRAKDVCQTVYYKYPAVTSQADPRNDRPIEFRDGRSSSATDGRYLTSYTYTFAGRLATQTNPEGGGQDKFTYTNGTEAAVGGGTVPSGLTLTATDPRSAVTRYAYTATGDLAQITAPSGLVTKYATDAIGRPKSETVISDSFPSGAVTTYGYDDLSNLTSVLSPATTNAVTAAPQQQRAEGTYDVDGNLVKVQRSDTAGGAATRTAVYDYDDHNLVERVTDAEGHETGYDYDRFGNVTAMVDAAGTRYEYAYTARNMVAEVRLRDFDGDPDGAPSTGDYLVLRSYVYDLAVRRVSEIDAMGRQVDIAYYGDDLFKSATLKEFTNPDGTKRDFVLAAAEYDGAGNPTRQVSDDGDTVREQTFDKVGRLQTTTEDPGGLNRRSTYQYDSGGNVTKLSRYGNPSNVNWALPTAPETTDYTYDSAGRPTKEIATDGVTSQTTSTTYDQRGLLTSMTDARGNVAGADKAAFTTTSTYDVLGRPIEVAAPPVSAESNGGPAVTMRPQTSTGYNVFGEVTETKDQRGNVARTEHDRLGQAVKHVAPSYTPPGASTPVTPATVNHFDEVGKLVKTVDPRGNETRFGYDRLGRLQTRDVPLATNGDRAKTHYDYTRTSELLTETDPTGSRIEATYDDLDRQVTRTAIERKPTPAARTSRYSYDDAGNVIKAVAPSGATETNVYDGLHQLTKTTDTAGVETLTGFDNFGRQVRTTDGLLRTSKLTFDPFGRMVRLSDLDPSGTELRSRRFTYDPVGNMTENLDREGHRTNFTYDAGNRLTKQVEEVTNTSSITTTYGYDAVGNRTRFTDGRGNSTISTVNSLGLPESVIEPSTASHPAPTDRTWTATYDVGGNLQNTSVPGGVSTQLTYDAGRRLTKETGAGAGAPTTDRVFGYDDAGRLTKVGSGSDTNTYGYNDRGLMLSADGPSGQASMVYDADGRLTERTDTAGTSTFGYLNGRLATVRDGITGVAQTLGYDTAGMPSRIDYGGGRIRTFGYDDLGRLSSDTLKNSSNTVVTSVEYGYDKCNRSTSKKTTGTAGAGQENFGYDYAGRITSWTSNGNTVEYSWDDSSNRTKTGTSTATYDQRNRLLTSGDTTYTHTPRGTLASKTGSGGQETYQSDAFDRLTVAGSTHYSYDGLNRLADRDGARFSYAGTDPGPVADGGARYSLGTAGDLLATASGGAERIAVSNRRFDLVAGFDPDVPLTGPADSVGYDPFGGVTATTGSRSNLGFHGDWTDPTTGQVNLAGRWYDPGTGTFDSREEQVGGPNPKSINANRYTYGHGSPLDMIDPSGNAPCGCFRPGWQAILGPIFPCPGPPYPRDVPRGPPEGEIYTPVNPGGPGGGPGGGGGGGGGGGPSPEDLERARRAAELARARARSEAAKRRAEHDAKNNARALPPGIEQPSYIDPDDKIDRPGKLPTHTRGTRDLVRDTVQSLQGMRAKAVRAAGQILPGVSRAAAAPTETLPVGYPAVPELPDVQPIRVIRPPVNAVPEPSPVLEGVGTGAGGGGPPLPKTTNAWPGEECPPGEVLTTFGCEDPWNTLNRVVQHYRRLFERDPERMREYLSPWEIEAALKRPYLAFSNAGKAIERAVAENPEIQAHFSHLGDETFNFASGPAKPDFQNTTNLELYEVTTASRSAFFDHINRSYVQPHTYVEYPTFPFGRGVLPRFPPR